MATWRRGSSYALPLITGLLIHMGADSCGRSLAGIVSSNPDGTWMSISCVPTLMLQCFFLIVMIIFSLS